MEILRAAGLRAPGGVHGTVGHHSDSIEGSPPMKAAVLYKPNTPLEVVEVDPPRCMLCDGTTRMAVKGEPLNQLARIGTFAEKVVCPAEQLVPMRKDMPWPQAALVGCCVPTGVGAVTRCAQVEAGSSVLIIG